MYPSPGELELLRQKLAARAPNTAQHGTFQNVQPIARPQKLTEYGRPSVHSLPSTEYGRPMNGHVHSLPSTEYGRPPVTAQIQSVPATDYGLRPPVTPQSLSQTATYLPSTHIRPLVVQPITVQPFRSLPNNGQTFTGTISGTTVTHPDYQSPQQLLPIEAPLHALVPIPVPNLSITPIPPLYDYRPFMVEAFSYNNVQEFNKNTDAPLRLLSANIVAGTGKATPPGKTISSISLLHQTHPVSTTQSGGQLTKSTQQTANPYGPPVQKLSTPTSEIEIIKSVAVAEFSPSQEFVPRRPGDSSSQGSDKIKSQFLGEPIVISESPSTVSPSIDNDSKQNYDGATLTSPIVQVLDEFSNSTESTGYSYQTPSTTFSSSEETSASAEYAYTGSSSTEEANASQRPSTVFGKKEPQIKSPRERGTPLNLLDSPISHFRKTSIAPTASKNPYDPRVTSVPDFKYMRNTWKPGNPAGFVSSVSTLAPPSSPSTLSPFYDTVENFASGSEENADSPEQDETQQKKKIQIIIPYTSKNHPSPFRSQPQGQYQNFDQTAGWSHSNHNDDFHDSQESQLIESATASPNRIQSNSKKNRYLTKILASNLRELLKKEHIKNISSVDLHELQKNIDGWTEQEFSLGPNRASTISLQVQSKHIPSEYLTTSPATKESYTQGTTTQASAATTLLQELLADQEYIGYNVIGSKLYDSNQMGSDQRDIYQTTQRIPSKKKKPAVLKGVRASATPATTTTTTTTQVPPVVRTTILPSAAEVWNKLKSLISASASGGKSEKVYVVTPQPHPFFESNEEITTYAYDNERLSGFKSPRFLVRPTPGTASSSSNVAILRKLTLPEKSKYKNKSIRVISIFAHDFNFTSSQNNIVLRTTQMQNII